MENSFQTSFIPKKPIIDNGLSVKRDKTMSISMVITVSLMFIMVGSTAGLFLYKNYLTNTKDQLSGSLAKMRDSFDENTIKELETYNKRSTVARDVLKGHVVLSPLFGLLNDLTISSIQYTKFMHNTENGIFSVKMSGIATDYKSIAEQADVFNSDKGKMLKNLIFSNLTKDKNNYVTFDLEFTVDPALLNYSNNITNISDVNSANTAPINTNTNITVGNTNQTSNTVAPTTDTSTTTASTTPNTNQQLPANNGTQ